MKVVYNRKEVAEDQTALRQEGMIEPGGLTAQKHLIATCNR